MRCLFEYFLPCCSGTEQSNKLLNRPGSIVLFDWPNKPPRKFRVLWLVASYTPRFRSWQLNKSSTHNLHPLSSCHTAMSGVYSARGLKNLFRIILRPASTVHGYGTVAEARAVLENELDGIRNAGTWKAERVITSKQGPQIVVDGSRKSK